MSEEEKKAIERFSKAFEYLNVWNKELTVVPEDKKYFLTVLNLLEKKDKESHFIQSELDIANAKIIELNKMIDLMAEWIEKHTKYYDEDGCYCEIEKDICNKNIECEYCIKQYFERKVENGN